MFSGIDLYSDTVTRPTPLMRKAMMEAEVGDEQKGEDPTTRRLETYVADRLGFEAALFMPTATMANEVALRALSEPGDEIIASHQAHILFAEAGGPAVHAGLMIRSVATASGVFSAEDVEKNLTWVKGPHYPVTRLVSVENTTNLGGGMVWPVETLRAVVTVAKNNGLRLHLDGSRLFNAAVKLGITPKQLTDGFDTVTICLSKGLGCPTGAVLAFSNERFESVRRLKQLMGGALRQSGILAAAGIYALENHVARLHEDHLNAERLVRSLRELAPIIAENDPPSTNMVFFRWVGKCPSNVFQDAVLRKGVRFSRVAENRFRAVTHLDVRKEDIDRVVEVLRGVCRELES